MASARVTVHDSRHPIRLTRVALGRSADCPVYQYLSESSQGARISRPRRRPRPRNRKRGNRGRGRGRGRFGCGSAALRCVAGCQPATAPVLKRHPLATVHRADWQSAKQQTRLSALLFIAARPGRVQQIRKCPNSARDLSRRKVSTALTHPQKSNGSFAHRHPCGLKSALRRSATTTLSTCGAPQKVRRSFPGALRRECPAGSVRADRRERTGLSREPELKQESRGQVRPCSYSSRILDPLCG